MIRILKFLRFWHLETKALKLELYKHKRWYIDHCSFAEVHNLNTLIANLHVSSRANMEL